MCTTNSKQCLFCQADISKHKKFCNNSCSAKYNNTRKSNEARTKQAATLSTTIKQKVENGTHTNNNPKGNQLKVRLQKQCPTCSTNFEVLPSADRIYCSAKCVQKGGYRDGTGKSKTGYYRGIYSGSQYELAWIIFMLDHNLPFERFPGYITDGKLKYYPDFLLPNNTIIEIKGYHQTLVDEKAALATLKGYNISILYEDDLVKVFDYVISKYELPINQLYKLYDNFKPKYQRQCYNCDKIYQSEQKLRSKTSLVNFCSRSCAGQYRAKIRHS